MYTATIMKLSNCIFITPFDYGNRPTKGINKRLSYCGEMRSLGLITPVACRIKSHQQNITQCSSNLVKC